MKKKAVFLDRDGTIIVEKNYLDSIKNVELLSNAIQGLKKMQELGYLLIIVSNQSGVARGYFTEKTVQEINDFIMTTLSMSGIAITDIYYCPHLLGGSIQAYNCNCNCRKPKTGMIEKACLKYDIDISKSFMIGDKDSDMIMAKTAGCQGIMVEGPNYNFISENYPLVKDLLEAAILIESGVGIENVSNFV